MKRSTSALLPIPIDPELKTLIKEAAERTHLSQADVMRSALRIGVPEVIKRLEVNGRPKRNLMEYVDAFRGLIRSNGEPVQRSRFK